MLKNNTTGKYAATKHVLLVALTIFPMAAQTRHVVAISHRGEHLQRPENTIPAFQEAIRVGADFIEVDVQTTADGKLVLSHDATVDRCTNGKGRVSEMTFEQVEALDAGIKKAPEYAGTKVPTFDEVLDLARGKIGIYVDVKNATAQDLVTHIDGHGMSDHVVIYCRATLCKQIEDLNPKLKVMPESSSVEHSHMLVDLLHPKVIAFGAGDWTPEIIAVAKQANAEVYVDRMGSTDGPEGWQSAIDAGADGIQTDRPGPLVEYLRQKGYK
jgi:glycerophosphoryl diester phosphodiesterase